MIDQEMEDSDSQLEESKFFLKYFKKFHKTKTVHLFFSEISFTSYEMNLALCYLLNYISTSIN